MANKFNSEGYYSPTEFEVFTKIEKEEAAVRKSASFRPIVYICSPYAGNIYDNILKARKYSRFAVDCHCIPFPPHLLFPQFMDDTTERDTAVFMNMVMLSKCHELWVFGDVISDGMKTEIDKAKKKHMKIRYFTEELEEVCR